MHSVRWLFLDMNAYFASVEQQLQPALRAKPVAVVPVMTNRTCCIAVSYEARQYGIRTGTNVGEARRRCPQLRLVEGRHENYIRIHEEIIQAVETVLPVEKVCSIDEMACKLSAHHREVEVALEVGRRVKQAIYDQVGQYLRCSVGLAPNAFLAKVASNYEKPNGLTAFTRADLPQKLYRFELDDLPGIGRGMLTRLHSCGIYTVRQLCSLSRESMLETWRSVLGEQWWYLLRGEEYSQLPTKRRSVSHSHVLGPEFRNDEGSRAVMVRLIHKAGMRLRRLGMWARRMSLSVRYVGGVPKWKRVIYLGLCQDTQSMLQAFEAAWSERSPEGTPLQVSMVLFDLVTQASAPLPLFPEEQRKTNVAHVIDRINERVGSNAIYFASMHDARQAAPMRIAFTHIPDVVAESE